MLRTSTKTIMNRIQYIQRLSYILELVRKGSLYSPYDLADKFECSEKTIRALINDLRYDGYNITYSRRLGKYILNQ